jgi:hypothetical protein
VLREATRKGLSGAVATSIGTAVAMAVLGQSEILLEATMIAGISGFVTAFILTYMEG